MAFDQEAVKTLFARVASPCKQIGAFRSSVLQHEPKSAPAVTPALALWWSGIGPARGFSGLAATSARVQYSGRLYLNFKSRPEDDVEEQLMTLTSLVIGAFTRAFTLDGDVAMVDVLGAYGDPLSATPGYVAHDGQEFRVAEIVIPIVADNVWSQSP